MTATISQGRVPDVCASSPRNGTSPPARKLIAEATAAWQRARDAAGCPQRLPAETLPVALARNRVTAAPVWALRSSPDYDAAAMDGIAVRATDTYGASESTPLLLAPEADTPTSLGCAR